MDATKEIEMSYGMRLSNIYFSVILTFVTFKTGTETCLAQKEGEGF
jgi:hypothetical protein